MLDNFVRTSPVTKYTSVFQYASHNIIRFYILIWFYIRRHFSRQPITCEKYTAVCQHVPQYITRLYIIPRLYIQRHFLRQPVTGAWKYHSPKNTFQTHIWVDFFPFSLFWIRVRVRVRFRVTVTVQSETRLKLV